MKHYKTVRVPAQEQRLLDIVTCDLCNKEIKQDCYHREEVTLEYEHGNFYPEGGSGEALSFDVCSTCFTEKLRPWLESQGAVPTVREIDY